MTAEPHSATVSRDSVQRGDELEGIKKLDTPATNAPQGSARKENGSLLGQAPPLSTGALSDFPDGGLNAWLQVAGSFFLIFAGWCVFLCFPRLQSAH